MLVVSQALTAEVIEKLLQHQIELNQVTELIASLERLAEWVKVPPEDVLSVIAADPDDDVILACGVIGKADYLVTYPHFDILNGEYHGIKITRALPFLWAVRGERPA